MKKFRYSARLIKNILLFLINYPIAILVHKLQQPVSHKNSILIVKPDNIGDYILFRNLLPFIKKKYSDKTIIYCGNMVCQEAAELLDSQTIDEFIWFNKNKFKRDLLYKIKTLLLLNNYSYEIATYPVLTREFFVGDIIVKSVHAKRKVASETLDCYMLSFLQNIAKRCIYDQVLSVNKSVLFEFYRNINFIEKFLNCKVEIDKPTLSIPYSNNAIDSKHVVLFIGGSEEIRRWSAFNYIELAKYIYKEYSIKSLFCGLSSDLDADIKRYMFEEYGVNLIDKTTIEEFINLIQTAELIITNDSVAQHIAASCDCYCIVISNGNDYGRFIPYPSEITKKYSAVFHPVIRKLSNEESLKEQYGYTSSKLNINEVTVADVEQTIDRVLK